MPYIQKNSLRPKMGSGMTKKMPMQEEMAKMPSRMDSMMKKYRMTEGGMMKRPQGTGATVVRKKKPMVLTH